MDNKNHRNSVLVTNKESILNLQNTKGSPIKAKKNIGRFPKKSQLKGKNLKKKKERKQTWNIGDEENIADGNKILKDLYEYNYIPEQGTIDKMKYYFASISPIDGFRKHMSFYNRKNQYTHCWDGVSRDILYQREGIHKKYLNPVFVSLKDADEKVQENDKGRNRRDGNKVSTEFKKIFKHSRMLYKLFKGKKQISKRPCEKTSKLSSITLQSSVGVRRRNESLFTPVRKERTKGDKMRCFSSACDMLGEDGKGLGDDSQDSFEDYFSNNLLRTPGNRYGRQSYTGSTGNSSTKNGDLLNLSAQEFVFPYSPQSNKSHMKVKRKIRKSKKDSLDLCYASHGLKSPSTSFKLKPSINIYNEDCEKLNSEDKPHLPKLLYAHQDGGREDVNKRLKKCFKLKLNLRKRRNMRNRVFFSDLNSSQNANRSIC